MVKRLVLLAAAMIVAGVLVGALGLETPAGAQAQTPDAPDVARTPPEQSSATGVTPRSPEASRMLRKAEREGSIRAIVGLRTEFVPEGRLNRAEAAAQRRGIENVGQELREALAGTAFRTLREYDTVPYIALRLTPQAFRAVQNTPLVTTIQEDVAESPHLTESAPVVQAPTMWENDYTGAGKTIAILDTGVDPNHLFTSGIDGDRIVEEACYSANSNCPNGTNTQTGSGAGVPCTYASEGCKHGTHVAGIAAGNWISAIFGVAPNADIMAVQVFSRFTGTDCSDEGEDPCAKTFVSDQLKGLERVYELRGGRTFAAVNMSLGGSTLSTTNCDTDARKAAIDNLRSISAATVISSGNDGSTNAVHSPACISSAITVGATTKPTVSTGESIASFSNTSSLVDLLAPGEGINSSVPGGGFEVKSGTSMAAPHVSGAWALIEHWDTGQEVTSVDSVLSRLQNTGTPVTDDRPGGTVTVPRINIADAVGVRPPNDPFGFPRAISGTSVSLSALNGGINGAATRESGEPDHLPAEGRSLGENSVWYRWTAPISGRVVVNTCASSFDTILAAYTGGSLGSLDRVAGKDDGCLAPNDLGSQMPFNAVAGTEYRIAVAGFHSDTRGEGTFTLKVGYAPPPNDFFADAQPIDRVPASVAGRNAGATRESGEPDHLPPSGGIRGERSVWYRWTAPSSGRMVVGTCTSSFDTILAAYTGGSLGSLDRVASDDNSCNAPNDLGSRISFNAVAGRNYSIAVATTRSRNEGTFTLSMLPPPEADYRFRNSRASSVSGAPALTDIGPGTNAFATATVDGTSRTVLQFPQANGLRLSPTTGVIPKGTYTIVALFELDRVDGFRRIIDFKNGTSDNGLYLQNGLLRFFPEAVQGTTPVDANNYVQVVLTRNAAGRVVGYVNGVRQFSFSDTANRAVIDAADALRFFKDNVSGGAGGEHSAGSVARIRLYDRVLSADQVAALDR